MADLLLGQPLSGGTLQLLSPNASKEEQTQVINDIINHLNASLKTQVFADGTSKRMLIGYQKDGWGAGNDFGIKVSLPGVDVTTASDSQLLFRMATDNWQWRNSTGALIKKMDIANGTDFYYDPNSGLDIGQQGILPDKSAGAAWSKSGQSVSGAFS